MEEEDRHIAQLEKELANLKKRKQESKSQVRKRNIGKLDNPKQENHDKMSSPHVYGI